MLDIWVSFDGFTAEYAGWQYWDECPITAVANVLEHVASLRDGEVQ